MGKYSAVLLGLGVMAAGIYLAVFVWWREFYEIVFGCIPPLLFFVGFIALIAGINGIKDSIRTKKLDSEVSVAESSNE